MSSMYQKFIFFGEDFFFTIGRVRSPKRQRETERQKARNHPPGGMTTLQSLLLYSPLGILGTRAHAPGVSLSHRVQDSSCGRLHGSPAT